jgi:hypothetical protein
MSAIEALRAALAAGPTPGPFIAVGEVVESADDEVPDLCSTSDRAEPWGFGPEQRVKDAAYIAAACNAATELLAEVDRLTAERDALRAALAELIEGAESMLCTCGVVWGETPEDSDTHTHDDWAEKFLSERLDAARAALKERT